MLKKIIMEPNADILTPIALHMCDACGQDLPHDAPRYTDNDKDYCGDCAFIAGLITSEEYVKKFLYYLDDPGLRAVIHNGEIYVGVGKFEWERTSRDRECKDYKEWRERVFKRDNYTCQHCGQYGGTLNAHHKKSYARYPELRTNVDNGITLCYDCHKQEHKKRGK